MKTIHVNILHSSQCQVSEVVSALFIMTLIITSLIFALLIAFINPPDKADRLQMQKKVQMQS